MILFFQPFNLLVLLFNQNFILLNLLAHLLNLDIGLLSCIFTLEHQLSCKGNLTIFRDRGCRECTALELFVWTVHRLLEIFEEHKVV